MVSPFLYFPDERLSLAELTAACLDGVLVGIGAGYMPADAAETPWMRARSLAPLTGKRLALVRHSAGWVHGGVLVEPSPHHLQRACERRVRVTHDIHVIYHDVRLDPADTMEVAGVAVATPTRALADLARLEEPAAAAAWAATDPDLAEQARAWIHERPRIPYGRRALDVLEGATAAERATAAEGATPRRGL
ncbi:SAM-dependent methyltransferase [Microbacterium testaceum StLB037]|uniref:SAM-dependent methyltransferase n=1 Tax=Microbacterium testaceum (strain StLB037) TaxID=979556 RepID=E8NFJ2_MICTS|nr:hypothetical protein [Microbacterium testaceum]BAJ76474.1 SAM-dependent methyltransferase [Microbacterium testaceum StLB037]